jgi:FMN phosphatase YigB (HAD superfamily)
MKLRAVIFDIYKTVLEVGPPPGDRDTRWETLAREALGVRPQLNLGEFAFACEQVIAREHTRARAVGIPFPEIFWPDIVMEVLPELGALAGKARDDFLFSQQALFRSVRLMPAAVEVLRALPGRGVLPGIASNAQPYTLRELGGALAGAGLSLDLFAADVSFWSFAHGFSKPDPHVFRLLTARLRARGVTPDATLMVGDRMDNDIMPARAQGWKTWQLTSATSGESSESGGDWPRLGDFIAAHT